VFRRIQFVWMFLCFGSYTWIYAGSITCSSAVGSSSLVGTACGSLFTPNDFLDWGAPHAASGYSGFGEAVNPAAATPPYGGSATTMNGVGVQVSSPNGMDIGRVDNTIYAWNGSFWTLPDLVAGQPIYTFGGHFDAPPTSSSPFGDHLLGVFNSTGSTSEMLLNLTPNSHVGGVAFRVSSTYNSDFTALLEAYDATNNLLGRYQVAAQGLGGSCAGLSAPDHGNDPVPCNDAPLIQFFDPSGQIASVKLSVDDPHGAVIDRLGLFEIQTVPEPGTELGAGIALGVILIFGRKRYLRSA